MAPEIETPVDTAEMVNGQALAGGQQMAQATSGAASLTSHLRGVMLPSAAELGGEESSEAKDKVAKVKLPKSLKEALAMLAEVREHRPADPEEAKLQTAMLERLREHVHALSQGPTCKPLTVSAHQALSRASSAHAEDIHITQLCRTDRIVEKRLKENAATIAEQQAWMAKASATIEGLEKRLAELTKQPE